MEQLDEKFKQLHVICAECGVSTAEVRDEIANSMESANKLGKTLPSQGEVHEGQLWVLWWVTFLMEWSHKCFARCAWKCRDWKDYHRMQHLWLSDFERLWLVGCDIARIDRLNGMKNVLSAFISRRSQPLPKSDEEKLWQWLNDFDKAALKAIDLFKDKQRRAIARSLEELRQYDKDSLLGKLKRLMSVGKSGADPGEMDDDSLLGKLKRLMSE